MFFLLLFSCTKKTGRGDNIQPPISTIPDTTNVLFNGIKIQSNWPPIRSATYDLQNGMQPPYLTKKPDTINISTGRQLFVDDFLIKETSMSQGFHYAEYYTSNPVLFPDRQWEDVQTQGSKFAAPFSDGVWYDEIQNKFKMWYMAGGGIYSVRGAGVMCYAESSDGISWTKPDLAVVPNTNITDYKTERDAATVWLDKEEQNSSLRYKMFLVAKDDLGKWRYIFKTSADGKLWREVATSQPIADRSTVYKNAFRNKWIFSMRHNIRKNADELIRARDYNEHTDPAEGTRKAEALLSSFWFGPWPSELPNPEFPTVQPAIYNLDAVPYESILLGMFTVWQGPENNVVDLTGRPKRNQVMLGYSRDGYYWWRKDMNPFIGIGQGISAWNAGNVQSVAGGPIIAGDKLYFYVSGRKMTGSSEITSTGLAILRRDGFVSMDAAGAEKYLLTELFKFDGAYFFVNANVTGSLKAELTDINGNVIPGYSKNDCIVYRGDATKSRIVWAGKTNLSELKGKAIRVKFYVTDGSLYAFWISPYDSGESRGYTAGGGPSLHISGKDLK